MEMLPMNPHAAKTQKQKEKPIDAATVLKFFVIRKAQIQARAMDIEEQAPFTFGGRISPYFFQISINMQGYLIIQACSENQRLRYHHCPTQRSHAQVESSDEGENAYEGHPSQVFQKTRVKVMTDHSFLEEEKHSKEKEWDGEEDLRGNQEKPPPNLVNEQGRRDRAVKFN